MPPVTIAHGAEKAIRTFLISRFYFRLSNINRSAEYPLNDKKGVWFHNYLATAIPLPALAQNGNALAVIP
jgi:hypothetical protein